MVVGQFGEFEGRLNIPGAIHHVITRGLSGFRSVRFKGPKSACVHYKLRSQCLRHPERTQIRQVAYFIGRTEKGKNTFTERMKRKIDSAAGRALYAIRLAIGEPPFANIRSALRLDRFTLRGKRKDFFYRLVVPWKKNQMSLGV
jgi:hypothetical protein